MHKYSFSFPLHFAIDLVKGTASLLIQVCKAMELALLFYQRGHIAPTTASARAKLTAPRRQLRRLCKSFFLACRMDTFLTRQC